MTNSAYVPLFEATRGRIVESTHFGAVAIVNVNGELVARLGEPTLCTYLRSSAKPFQALPFIEAHGEEHFHLSRQEVAILCASHAGTDEHVRVVSAIQKKIGITEQDLLCGTHTPFNGETSRRMIQNGEELTPNRHNCSGKHTGMIALAMMQGVPVEDYISIQHPIQQQILRVFSEMVDLKPDEVEIGIDGCSVPTFAVPLHHAALGYARLADPSKLNPDRAAAIRQIVRAMTGNPMMIAGPKLFDTLLMDIAGNKFLTKMGAEGFQALAILPDAIERGSQGMGIALKIAEGDLDGRARPLVMLELLRQIGAISAYELNALKDLGRRPIYNFRHLQVGEYRPAFTLKL
jgi:L-asparaginase II